jgi:long-subunit acyl-CoA synthetase (AMP-forming)
VVIRDQGIRLTFAALRQEVDRLAAGLIALGLQPGDRIGIWSPNRIEWVLTQYAAAWACAAGEARKGIESVVTRSKTCNASTKAISPVAKA